MHGAVGRHLEEVPEKSIERKLGEQVSKKGEHLIEKQVEGKEGKEEEKEGNSAESGDSDRDEDGEESRKRRERAARASREPTIDLTNFLPDI